MAHTAFLRASGEAAELDIDVSCVADGGAPAVAFGAELSELAQAMGTDWTSPPTRAREALISAAGPEVAERAIGVAATFQMMNRLLDGVGAPVHERLHPLARELGFEPASMGR